MRRRNVYIESRYVIGNNQRARYFVVSFRMQNIANEIYSRDGNLSIIKLFLKIYFM